MFLIPDATFRVFYHKTWNNYMKDKSYVDSRRYREDILDEYGIKAYKIEGVSYWGYGFDTESELLVFILRYT
jgi:hypothetical protein